MNQIVPIQKINPLEDMGASGGSAAQPAGLPFQSLFEDAVNNVKQTDATLNTEVYKMTTGQSDNLHDVVIASQKASLSVDLLVQMRNKVLDSYNEIMRMSV
ncbi:flagellar hook-basal body complex protein FliE [Caproicibacter sp.]|uniref:flagellar hook-basal body complex protein FliE n=1 Tax=Caproicibacter sp. TaxID=2814884 RepID=UPI00398A1FD6